MKFSRDVMLALGQVNQDVAADMELSHMTDEEAEEALAEACIDQVRYRREEFLEANREFDVLFGEYGYDAVLTEVEKCVVLP